MKLIKQTRVNRFLNAFKQEKTKEVISLANRCKSVIFRFKNVYIIEVISKYEYNDNYFKPFKR